MKHRRIGHDEERRQPLVVDEDLGCPSLAATGYLEGIAGQLAPLALLALATIWHCDTR